MHDLLHEIWSSIKRNKLRTCLTGLAVSWGIFIIILLLGAGNGLMNAFHQQSSNVATNTMRLDGGQTSKPYAGLQQGRYIKLKEADVQLLKSPMFEDVIDEVSVMKFSFNNTLVYGTLTKTVSLCGTYPGQVEMECENILAGRYITYNDINLKQNVAVISDAQAEDLLNGHQNYNAIIGRYVSIDNSSYMVVGVRQGDRMWRDDRVHIPYSTFKILHGNNDEVDRITFTFHGLKTEKENEQFEKKIRAILNLRHDAAPDDEGAIYIWNRFTQDMSMNKATSVLTKALWVVGIFTLLGGIVGVSNIMLITVKERTHEFGIRKAIGAKPWAITKLILAESVSITTIFGVFGMLLGLLACEIMDATVGSSAIHIMTKSFSIFVNPRVGLDVAIEATVVLIVAGTIAGMSPALKAAKVRPIEALKSGK